MLKQELMVAQHIFSCTTKSLGKYIHHTHCFSITFWLCNLTEFNRFLLQLPTSHLISIWNLFLNEVQNLSSINIPKTKPRLFFPLFLGRMQFCFCFTVCTDIYIGKWRKHVSMYAPTFFTPSHFTCIRKRVHHNSKFYP